MCKNLLSNGLTCVCEIEIRLNSLIGRATEIVKCIRKFNLYNFTRKRQTPFYKCHFKTIIKYVSLMHNVQREYTNIQMYNIIFYILYVLMSKGLGPTTSTRKRKKRKKQN